ncbi:MAG TPA: bis(5'-nucleosyl)-tetraphosphatase (symmetrical), partial [Macromonas sp.]|nr:bis(5'-nucleosyl)-tetraphosphatase (symmetrical) [Macromonas sp.]
YGNLPAQWSDDLQGADRWRVVVNALTRLRFCNAEGVMEFATKDSAAAAPPGFMPWFDVPGRRSADTPVAFGHWSTLGLLHRPKLLALDTGCVWGGCLSAARLPAPGPGEGPAPLAFIQIPCPQAQAPGR